MMEPWSESRALPLRVHLGVGSVAGFISLLLAGPEAIPGDRALLQ